MQFCVHHLRDRFEGFARFDRDLHLRHRQLYVGILRSYSWTQKIVTLKGKKFKSIVGKITPKTGNPITDKISEKKKVKSSKGAVKYVQDITACSTSGSCLDGQVGIITQ